MKDMKPAQVASREYRETELTFFDGSSRRVFLVDEEIPYPDGKLIVSRTNTQGIITHMNQSFVDMSAYSEDELIGAPHSILRHPDMPAVAFQDLWATISQGKKWHGYVKNLRKDGRYYWVYASVIPNIRGGKIMGYTSVRRKPARAKIKACLPLYAQWLKEEAAHV